MNNFPIELSEVYLQKAQKLNVNSGDVSEAFVRGSGHGGQKINKTSSCVLLRHFPTGIEVRCQEFREQSRNRLYAWRLLIDKIEEKVNFAESKRAKMIFKIRKQKMRRSKRAKEKMLEEKKRRGEVKESRRMMRISNV